MGPLNPSDLKRVILQAAAEAAPGHVHKINLVGRPYEPGGLERRLNIRLDAEQRALAARAFDELRATGFLRPTYADLADPENWVEITDAGREALTTGTFMKADVLDPTSRELEQKFGILWSPGQAERDFNTWANADRDAGRPVGIVFLDIDHFKALNTAHTETTVDQAILRPFQQLLTELCAHRGEGYRYGGDEFIVLLRNCDLKETSEFAERLRVRLAAASFAVGQDPVRVTVSVGVASWPANGGTYHDVLHAANQAKAKAKETRNAVRLASLQAIESQEPPGALPPASDEEIQKLENWLESPSPKVRRDAANELLGLIRKKRVFHYQPLRGAIRRLLKDQEEEIRAKGLEILTALMRWERASVARYYAQPLIALAEGDASTSVRARAMSAIGATGDSYYCERVYLWIVQWPDEIYGQVNPVAALIGLAHSGLTNKIRDDLRSLLERTYEPSAEARLADALKAVSELQ